MAERASALPVAIYDQLIVALCEFDAAVATARAGGPVDLQTIFRRLDGLTLQLPPDADPQLRHFLEQKSYQKAHALLEATGRPG